MAFSLVGTWTGFSTIAIPNSATQPYQAVIQFHADNTFIEGFDLAGNAATYLGVYLFDPRSQRIAYEITGAAPATGPVPSPALNIPTLSSTVEIGSPSELRLNNNILFTFKNTSVSLADFVLPSLPTPSAPPLGGGVRAAIAEPDLSNPIMMPDHNT